MKEIIGYEKLYWIDEDGRVFSERSQRYLKPNVHSNGYHAVDLRKDGTHKTVKLHRLVAEYFIPNPDNLSTVNHKDGDKSNNYVDNLEFMSQENNNKHAYATGLKNNTGENNGRSKLTKELVLEIREIYSTGKYSFNELSKIFGIHSTNISRVINKKTWTHI